MGKDFKKSNDDKLSIPQHSIGKSIFYHLFPGLCILLFYLIITPYLIEIGFNSSIGLIVSFAMVGIPIQLSILLSEGVKTNESYSLKNVIFYREKIPFWQYIVFSITFIIYALIVSSALNGVNEYLLTNYFSWLPNWFTDQSPSINQPIDSNIIFISLIGIFLIDGLINPIVEEIYFRGFLLPRISRYRIWSPLINAILFALAHFWQPWNFLQIFIMIVPVYYLVWRKRNIYISIFIHCLANILGGIFAYGHYLSS